MPQPIRSARLRTRLIRALIEVGFILFLFYANLLMGEFTRTSGRHKTLAFALHDIFTPENFTIAIITAIIGYFLYEFLNRSV